MRGYQARDEAAVLELVAADRVAGQPGVTGWMLGEALAGRSVVDGGWWEALESPTTEVLCDPAGVVVGVVSYAVRPSDGAGVLLWLHCREEAVLVEALLDRVLGQFGGRAVYAFEFASALSLGLEGLPVRHRGVTRRVLEAAGFSGADLWRYMRVDLPVAGLPRAGHVVVTEGEERLGRQLEVREGGETLAQATIGRPVDGIGVLWWISVAPPARRRGLGLALLGSALGLLTELGAREAILYVDDDAPAGDPERDRTPANALYERAGFTEVDRLHSFCRRV